MRYIVKDNGCENHKIKRRAKMSSRVKKNSILVSALIMIVFFVISTSVIASSGFLVQIEPGFSGFVKHDKVIPFGIDITNSGKDFDGKVEVYVNYEDERDPRFLKYEENLNLPQNSSKKIVLPIYAEQPETNEYVVKIVDNNGNIIFEKSESWFNEEYSESAGYGEIGVIAESVEQYRELNGNLIQLENNKIINKEVLDLFQYIILSNEVNKLTNEQIDYLKEWRNSGGYFIVDSRSKAWAENNIGLANTNYSEIDSNSIDMINELLKDRKVVSNDNDRYWYSDWYTATIPAKLAPKFDLLKIVLMIFVVVVGPVNYLVLKQIDRREFLWISVPAIVLVFSIGVYAISSNTELKGPVMSKASYVELNPNSNVAKISSSSSIFATTENECILEFLNDVKVNYGKIRAYDFNKNKENVFVTNNIVQKTLKYKNNGFWSPTTIPIDWETDSIGNINTELKLEDNTIRGIIKNETGYLLEDMVFVFDKTIVFLGDLRVGEEKIVEIDLKRGKETNWSDIEISDLYYSDERSKYLESQGIDTSENNEKNYLTEDFKQSFSNRFFDSKYKSSEKRFGNYIIVAWNEENLDFSSMMNGKEMNQLNRNMIYSFGEIQMEKGSVVTGSTDLLVVEVKNVNGLEYDTRRDYLYGVGSAEIHYREVESDVDINEWQFYLDESQGTNYQIFNIKENNWEDIQNGKILNSEDIDKYMDEDKTIVLKINSNVDDSVSLPEIRVQGVVN
jgi:hypothetical protein